VSKKWYPVINFEGCIDGCRGCQNLCPTEAISYVGEIKEMKVEIAVAHVAINDNGGCC